MKWRIQTLLLRVEDNEKFDCKCSSDTSDKAFYKEKAAWQWLKEEMPFITLNTSILVTKLGTQ